MKYKKPKPGNVTGRPEVKPTCADGVCSTPKDCAQMGGCLIELKKGKGKKR